MNRHIYFCMGISIWLLLAFASCRHAEREKEAIAWGPAADSLLRDTVAVNPLVDSLRLAVLHASHDSLAIDHINELAERWRGEPTYILALEAEKQSRQRHYTYGVLDAQCRLGLYYSRVAAYEKADSVLDLVLSAKPPGKIQAYTLSMLGNLARFQDEYDKAMKYYDQSIALAKTVNDDARMAYCLGAKGVMYNIQSEYGKAMESHDQALKLSEKIHDQTLICFCLSNIGEVYRLQDDYQNAISYYDRALDIAAQIGDKPSLAVCYSRMGEICRMQSDYSQAADYYNRSISIAREINDKNRIAFCLSSMGDVYRMQSNRPKALEYYNKSLDMAREINDKASIVFCLSTMGDIYSKDNDFAQALQYYDEALALAKQINDNISVGFCEYSIGEVHKGQKQYDKALQKFSQALAIAQEINDKNLEAFCLTQIGEVKLEQNNVQEAQRYAEKSAAVARESEIPDNVKNSAALLYKMYARKGDYKNAFESHRLFVQMKDSINSEEQVRKFAAREYEAREQELKTEQQRKEAVLQAEQVRQEAVIRQQKLVRNGLIAGAVLLLGFAFFIYRSLSQSRKANKIIEEQKQEVEHQKGLVEEKQKEVMDSITYAKRLQEAILPPVSVFGQTLGAGPLGDPNYFVLYKPKDIVAGDFYWLETLDEQVFVAAADSTGHGVPGAMVSVVCSNALNRAVKEFRLSDTGHILDKTRDLVLDTFVRSGSDVKDGMDISLLSINRKSNTVYWSGANNPLWYILPGETHVTAIKPDKQPIGKTDNPKPFTTHAISCPPGTILYLLTDGYADQFGGPKGKKFKYKQLEELLLTLCHLPLPQQAEVLKRQFEDWRGLLDQVDDVTILGIRL